MSLRDLVVELRIAGLRDTALRVEGLTGRERSNELYAFTVEVAAADDGAELESAALGREATLSLSLGGQGLHGLEGRGRRITGLVTGIEQRGRLVSGVRARQYRVHLAPRAHLLTLRRNSRVFQDMRIVDVLREVFAPYFIPVRFAQREELPLRKFITQLEETDWAFVQRLAADAGLAMIFEPPGPEALAEDAVRGVLEAARRTLGDLAEAGPLADVLAVPEARETLVFIDDPRAYPATRTRLVELPRVVPSAGAALGDVRGLVESFVPDAVLPDAALPEDGDGVTLRMRGDERGLHEADELVLTELTRHCTLSTERAVFDEFDAAAPRRMLQHAFGGEGGSTEAVTEALAAIREGVGRGLAAAGVGPLPESARALRDLFEDHQPLEHYLHHASHLFPDSEQDQREARRALRLERRDAELAVGESQCPWLSAGHWFRLVDHEVDRMNRRWVPIAVDHELTTGHEYACKLTCVPAETLYPAKAAAPRKVQVCYTATVTGAEPVHTEERGMVEVRFHWDRQNRRRGTRSSCWLRVMQPWTGPGFGAQFLPRVGTEVVVTFEGGNPDKPFVLGGVHNAENPTPFNLPEERTKSGIRTQTVGGEGSNELSFEDAQGHERIFVHAERNLEIDVERDRVAHIKHLDQLHVEGARVVRVEGTSRAEHVGRRETVSHGGDGSTVHGSREVTTQGDEHHRVSGDLRTQVDGGCFRTHRGRLTLNAESDVIERVGGNLVRIVGSEKGSGTYATRVNGDLRMESRDVLQLTSDKAILLRCGDSTLRIDPDKVTIQSETIVLDSGKALMTLGGGDARIFCDGGDAQVVAEKVLLKASGSGVALTSEAAIEGSQVLLNSPANATDAATPASTERTWVVLTDRDGEPIPDQEFTVTLDDGTQFGGMTDREGRAALDLEQVGNIEFHGLREVDQG